MSRLPTRAALLGLALAATCLLAVIAAELNGSAEDDPATTAAAPRPAAPAAAAPAADPAEDHLDEWVDTVLARPLFMRDRRPEDAPAAVAGVPGGPEGVPRLAGVVVGPDGRSAIFAGEGDAKPFVLREGAAVAGFTIQSIEPGQVTLAGPEGKRVLRPAFDPNPPKRPPATLPGLPGVPGVPGQPAVRPAAGLPPVGGGFAPNRPDQPGFGQPGFGQPGLNQPGLGQPGLGQPGLDQPGINQDSSLPPPSPFATNAQGAPVPLAAP